MTFQLIFTAQYEKRAARFLKRHPELEKQYLKVLQLLELNPHHPSLRLHALSGRLQGLHSVSINISCRITLELLIQDEEIIPVNVVDHATAYQQESVNKTIRVDRLHIRRERVDSPICKCRDQGKKN